MAFVSADILLVTAPSFRGEFALLVEDLHGVAQALNFLVVHIRPYSRRDFAHIAPGFGAYAAGPAAFVRLADGGSHGVGPPLPRLGQLFEGGQGLQIILGEGGKCLAFAHGSRQHGEPPHLRVHLVHVILLADAVIHQADGGAGRHADIAVFGAFVGVEAQGVQQSQAARGGGVRVGKIAHGYLVSGIRKPAGAGCCVFAAVTILASSCAGFFRRVSGTPLLPGSVAGGTLATGV